MSVLVAILKCFAYSYRLKAYPGATEAYAFGAAAFAGAKHTMLAQQKLCCFTPFPLPMFGKIGQHHK